jgi:hypothetical protein
MYRTMLVAAFALLLQSLAPGSNAVPAQTAYPSMAALEQYLMPDKKAEIELARTAAPASISGNAEVMVLGRDGYTTAANGTNGFVCIVERSWGAASTEPEFWNPKIRSPICFNPPAARTVLPIYLMKTRSIVAGKSRAQVLSATDAAFAGGQLHAPAPGAMCYMMSHQQYLNDRGKSWHPHLMFFVSGDAAKTWGADLPGVPVMAANDPEERVTIMMVLVGHWSDGTAMAVDGH